MAPLTLDDLFPLEEFAGRRREFLQAHERYLDRYRRVRIGPRLTLLFENRQTLWFRVQEILRIARLADANRMQQELNVYNRLLPDRNRLQAALIIEVTDEARLVEELAPFRNIQGNQLRFCLGEESIPATLVTCRPEDRCIGAAHWVQFHLDTLSRNRLADQGQPALIEFDNTHYRQQSPLLNEDIRQSLLDDLVLSDRDEKVA